MTTFYDRRVQYANRFKLTDLGDGIVSLDREEGEVYQEGTKLNAETLNDIFSALVAAIDTKVEKETGKGLSTNDFTNLYIDKIKYNETTVNNLLQVSSTITYGNIENPTTFELICSTSEAIKHANSSHDWYVVRNGFCYIQLDLDIVNKNINQVAIIDNLPLPIDPNKEIWDNIVGQGANIGNNLLFKIAKNADDETKATLTIDRASTTGRYMGTIIYPIAIDALVANTEE